MVAVKNLPARIESRAIAVPSWLNAKCAVPAGDGRIAAAGWGTVELYATRKQLASVPCAKVEAVAAVHAGRVIVASALGGDLVVYAVVEDTLAELARFKARINPYSLSTSGDRVFVSRATGSFEVVGLLQAYAGHAARAPEIPETESASGIALRPIANGKVPKADDFDPTGVDWESLAGRGGTGNASAIAVRPDGKAAVVCWADELRWAPAKGKGTRLAKLASGSIIGAEFVGDDAVVVLATNRLQRFAVTTKSAKLTATLDVEFGAALAVQRDRTRLVALVVEAGENIGRAMVFDAQLRQLAAFDGLARVVAAGGRLFAFDRKSKAFEIATAAPRA